ncbi:hypothetical protein BDF20DRAFT_854332 [Mycotypha africana]|uniref:uncharacterized protein n=1 Tax=Mycotypha africana TaxID=64632 RepID=UPI002300D911|nr:uncharacterized protein BDF20DRAFT_854332 [Mycotypha africana]KAI8988182.1 hypothetical protein BDF20DRAFT_854332 [Mycotypha africana]
MSSRLITRTSLLNKAVCARTVRLYATETKAAATTATEQFPAETFGGNAWRNGLIAVVAGFIWYRVDQHITHSGDEKHPFTKWIEYHMSTAEENDQYSHAKIEAAKAAAEYKLLVQSSDRRPIYRMRNTELFERHSSRGYTMGTQCDLSDLKIRSD